MEPQSNDQELNPHQDATASEPGATNPDAAADASGAAGSSDATIDPSVEEELDAVLADAEQEAASADTAEGTEPADAAGAADASSAIEAELAERTEDLQRVTAEFTNYRRRVERDRFAIVDGAKADVAAKLLPLLDDLDLAESHGDLEGPLKSIHSKLHGVLEEIKVEAFGEVGEEFNPDLHEAVQDGSTGDDKALATVLRKGYRMGDRVIRTAMVIIGDPQ